MIDKSSLASIDTRLPSIDGARLNALRNLYKPSETSTYNNSQQSEDGSEPMMVEQATEGLTVKIRKEKTPKHLKRGANEKKMDSFAKSVLRIPMNKPFGEYVYFESNVNCILKHRSPLSLIRRSILRLKPRWANMMMHRSTVGLAKTVTRALRFTLLSLQKGSRVVQLDDYGVYRDEDGNAQTLDGWIINASKEDIVAILEMEVIKSFVGT
ncbi:hypothetical protein DY000_02016124 [Brassica cretica]|uniref:Uncharacterized protein n=1 Tax=Brassica cretica TaxID=69181 RepID=A0ABQ7D7R3_BRACR|nr:hypothetical protein DY000_02016124 [Brassica cretica]